MSQLPEQSIDERIAQRRARTAELKKKRKRQMFVRFSAVVLGVILIAMVGFFALNAFSNGSRPSNTTAKDQVTEDPSMQVIQSDLDGDKETGETTPEKQPVTGSGETQTDSTTPEGTQEQTPADEEVDVPPRNEGETEDDAVQQEPVADEPVTNVGRYAETVIYVDPGRGYSDLGCTSDYLNGLHEQQINLDVALQTAQLLTDYGFTVLMTHDTNEIPAGQAEDYVLDQYTRVDMANHSDCAVYLSIHCDYFPTNPDASGTRLYYCTDNTDAAAFAEALTRGFKKEGFAAPQISGKDRNNSFIVTSQVTAPSVLAELGFVTNQADAKALSDAAHRTKLAQALAAGVIAYLGLEE